MEGENEYNYIYFRTTEEVNDFMKENCKIFSGLVKKLSVGSEINVFLEGFMHYFGDYRSYLSAYDNA